MEFFAQDDRLISIMFLIHVKVILLYVLTELGYALICQVTEKRKCSFEMLWEKRAKAHLEIIKFLVIKGLFNVISFNWENNYEMDDLHTCRIDQTHMET